MKPLNRKNYGSIPHLLGSRVGKTDKYVHEGQHRIMTEKLRDKHDLLIVTEKYDGSNVGIAKVKGKIITLTRSGYLAKTSPYMQHHYFADWVEEHKARFQFICEGERLVGEWLMQAHGTRYEIKNEPFVCFDLFTPDNNRLNSNDFYLRVRTFVQVPRLIWMAKEPIAIEKAMNFLNIDIDPRFKTDKPEGLVYRIERKGKFDFMAKYVRPNFQPGKYCIGIDDPDLIWNVDPY